MKKNLVLLFSILVLNTPVYAQNKTDRLKISDRTNAAYLMQLSNALTELHLQQREETERKALERNLPIVIYMGDSTVIFLKRFDEKDNPVYISTHNVAAATTTRTNEIQSGGIAGYMLDGTNIVIGQWDGGDVLSTHQQLAGRVTNIDAAGVNNHATHVCGTIAGNGTGNTNAKGMAPNATVRAYHFGNDEAEMAAEAASGMLLSNHSYGTISGWNQFGTDYAWFGDTAVNANESYLFGWYNDDAALWDDIAYHAPYYLIVKSSGNDRNRTAPNGANYTLWGSGPTYVNSGGTYRPPNGQPSGFDCIATYAVAKNILTVGNIDDVPVYNSPGSVTLNPSSGTGPTDDGRIKPDIVANGVSVLSASSTSNTSYTTMTGTSMSTPNVTGSCALLQQHFANTHNDDYMLAATLKALVIHTADECGSAEGPDYTFGWGLMNARKAADLIRQDSIYNYLITENSLSNGNTFSLNVIANGFEPLIATIAWIDPAGNAIPISADNPTTNLVNDLDIRISHNSITYFPYVLDPSNPSTAATKSDNFRDNVEKIYINSPDTNGVYTITITHKGTLASAQNFSLILSGVGNLQCANPRSFSVGNITETSAIVTWLSSNVGASYLLNYNGNNISGTVTTANMQIALSGLSEATLYEISLTEDCGGSNGLSEQIGTLSFFTSCSSLPSAEMLPFSEDFVSFPPANWTLVNPDGGLTWTTLTPPGCPKGQSASLYNYNYNARGQQDALVTPFIDLTTMSEAALTFDLAYAPYNNLNYEALKVDVINCDETAEINVYHKKEISLGTRGGYFSSPFAPLICDYWRTETINLNQFAGQVIKLKFTNVNGYGNYIYLDNVAVNGTESLALPVTWLHFQAAKKDDYSILNWATATEINNDFFQIERSTDGINFNIIGKQKGAGNSTQTTNYEFIDIAPVNGINYYRLKQVDFDGHFEYSPIRVTKFNSSFNNELIVYPNPADNQVYVLVPEHYSDGESTLHIINSFGQVIKSESLLSRENSLTAINLNDVAAGVYFIQIKHSSGTNQIQKIIVNRH